MPFCHSESARSGRFRMTERGGVVLGSSVVAVTGCGYVLSETEIGAYASGDSRSQLLEQLGFVTPQEFDDLAGDLFYSSFSYEEISRLHRDVLVWISSDPSVTEAIEANPLRQQLTAATTGREVFLGQEQAGAFSFSNVLSLPYAVETLVPQLEAAADGDPATEVPVAD